MTNAGNVRDTNEDAFLNAPAAGIWAVADGMGGHDAGDVASRMVVAGLEGTRPSEHASVVVSQVRDSLEAANAQLFAMAGAGDETATIGTTVAVLVVHGDQYTCIWSGDSRVYRLRDLTLDQLTRDHSELEYLVAEHGMSRQDARSHTNANVINHAIGGAAELEIEMCFDSLKSRDRFLICSDGLTREVPGEEVALLLSRGSCTEACQNLMQRALVGRAPDNVTVVTVDFEEID